jgi:hypothetical protein
VTVCDCPVPELARSLARLDQEENVSYQLLSFVRSAAKKKQSKTKEKKKEEEKERLTSSHARAPNNWTLSHLPKTQFNTYISHQQYKFKTIYVHIHTHTSCILCGLGN